MGLFDNKTVLVTGGNSGIGQTIALDFAKQGAKVVITGRRQSAVDETVALHSDIHGFVGDVANVDDARAAVAKAVEVGGGLDVLVNNAGIFSMSSLAEIAPQAMIDLFSVNVFGLTYVTQAALPHIIGSKGSIINIGSGAGHRPVPGISHYGATKAAVESLTKSWALELASSGVRVNCVAPGPTETPIFGKTGLSQEQTAGLLNQMTSGIPLGRIGQPQDVSTWVLNLASPTGAFVTGQIITVDGGNNLK